ncbi:hypothetical protein ACFCY8_26695 [Streptomyces noursei]|uniref:hypothetical protein n=1 Tax=Streptomyces noursei TaxID=1971 RepID=UPI0035E3ABC2
MLSPNQRIVVLLYAASEQNSEGAVITRATELAETLGMTPPVFSRTLVRPLTAACQPACSPSCAPDAGRRGPGPPAGLHRPAGGERPLAGGKPLRLAWPAPGVRLQLAYVTAPARGVGRVGGVLAPAGGLLGVPLRPVVRGGHWAVVPAALPKDAEGAGQLALQGVLERVPAAEGAAVAGEGPAGTGECAAVLAVLELEETIKKEGPPACSTARSRACCGS